MKYTIFQKKKKKKKKRAVAWRNGTCCCVPENNLHATKEVCLEALVFANEKRLAAGWRSRSQSLEARNGVTGEIWTRRPLCFHI